MSDDNNNGYSQFELEVVQRLTSIETKQDAVNGWIVSHDAQAAEGYKRLASLEASRNWFRGVFTLIGLLGATIIAWAAKVSAHVWGPHASVK